MPEENDRKEYYESIDWYDELRKVHKDTDISALVLERLNQSQRFWQRKGLTHALQSEYRRQNRFTEAAQLLELEATSDPGNPLPLIILAEQKMYHESDLAAALIAVERALDTAGRSGNFRRHALPASAHPRSARHAAGTTT